jgi:hypothetical protein
MTYPVEKAFDSRRLHQLQVAFFSSLSFKGKIGRNFVRDLYVAPF